MNATMQRRLLFIFLFFVLVAGGTYVSLFGSTTKTFTLAFNATSGDVPFVFDKYDHADPIGGEPFQLRDFRFYVSNVNLSDSNSSYAVPESYYLVRFDARSGTHKITLPDVPLREVTKLSFSIGLDPEANKTIAPLGDVDPNSRMAWNWAIGYKFILVEGELRSDNGIVPLVYHVGFDENVRHITLRYAGKTSEIPISVDVMKLFDSKVTLDLSELSTIKMDRADSRMMADNYATMMRIAD